MAPSQHRYVRLESDLQDDDPPGAHAPQTIGSPGGGDIELQPVRKQLGWPSDKSDESFADNDDRGRLLGPRQAGFDGVEGGSSDDHLFPRTYPQRWIQLGYLSTLALVSDWVCFSTASIPDVFEEAYPGKTSEGLIDKFLFMNVASCLAVTDAVARFGLQRCTKASSLVMAIGCWLRCGLGIVPVIFDMLGIRERHAEWLKVEAFGAPLFGLPPYPILVTGTLLVGMAQPFFQCTPPLLSEQWFASNERATSSAVALNFNQVGIAVAFIVAGSMVGDDASEDGDAANEGLMRYFALIAALSTILSIGTFLQFQNLPPVPPSASEMEKLQKGPNHEPPFHVSVRTFFSTPALRGRSRHEVMERGGVTDRRAIAWAGAGFEMAIVLGGVILGKYVDRTKEYKRVTKACILLSLVFLLPLGLTDHKVGKEPVLLVISLFLLGFFVGPVQPINAELAVDVTYPGDETAVESVQQFGGNFCSALFVPVAGRAAKLDYDIFPNVNLLASDIRGDVIFMMALSIATYWFYRSFNAPLRRSMADGE